MLEDLLTRRTQVKASLALEQKRVIALRGALAETEGSDSGHSGGGSESTSGDSSLEQVVTTIPGLGDWLISMLVFICFNFSSFANLLQVDLILKAHRRRSKDLDFLSAGD